MHNSTDSTHTGYCVDLMQRLSQLTGLSFKLRLVSDGSFGTIEPRTKQWTGMIGELIRNVYLKIDLTIKSMWLL